ncbi:glycosyltransferase family 2 protein [Flaviaesturariibacter aridisoli]|uniref:Glycosyltransferase n=1 Tax=Flaviaesturariibacter aridisoli TaxID=2545761 RepID=A0A4R4DYS0_9BACT|nr:glycosyltransferase family 2 protein [Flaviaesturariibacter aridisoli]TCZ67080.1 glycosyltransferase [Flaviaesturariibacter aridisoli]
MKQVDIVIPVFNEAENIAGLVAAVQAVMDGLPYNYGFILVDDGSSDGTLSVLQGLSAHDPRVRYRSFSRNFGHQAALKAGLDASTGDCAISLDGDFQHPPELIPQLLQHWEEGYDVVYTLRRDEDKQAGSMKRWTSDQFYNFMNRMADLDLEKGSADFRLLDRKCVRVLQKMQEHEPFFRGLVKWIGFRQVAVEYQPAARRAGRSKYTFRKMMRFALQGITSFSTKPLFFAAYLGFVFAMASVLYLPYALISYYFGHVVNGWTSVIVTITFFGGLQLCILGIMGLYLGKVFMQGKDRPMYLVKEETTGS